MTLKSTIHTSPSRPLVRAPRPVLTALPAPALSPRAGRWLPLLGLLLLFWPTAVQAQVSDFYWTELPNNTVTITRYNGAGGAVVIPSSISGKPVTIIGTEVFFDNPTITSVAIPDSVVLISTSAFYSCLNLTSISIPDSVRSIGATAFAVCRGLTEIVIGSGVTNIGDSAFGNCNNLKSVYMKGNAPTLGLNVFWADYDATVYYLPGTTGWVAGATYGNLPTTPFPYRFTSAGGQVTISDYSGVGGALTVPATIYGEPVTRMLYAYVPGQTYAAPDNPSVTSLALPDSLVNIDSNALISFPNLTSITVGPANPAYSTVAGVLFNKAMSTLVQFPRTKAGGYTIPSSVTHIGGAAFIASVNLTSVTIPDSVTSIGGGAFSSCTGLASITIPATISRIEPATFGNCASLTSVIIPDSVTSIGEKAFWLCSSLTGVTIGNRVFTIEDYAFYGCTSLSGVYFKGGPPAVGADVFLNGGNPIVYYPSATPGWVEGALFGGQPTELFPFKYSNAGGQATIEQYTGDEPMVTIPETIMGQPVTRLADLTFYNKTNLLGVALPASVTTIGSFAFSQCLNLTGVYFKGSPPVLGANVFLSVGNPIVYYPAATPGWVEGALFGGRPTKLFPFTYSNAGGQTTIEQYTGDEPVVTIPETIMGQPVTRLADLSFYNKTNLLGVAIPASVTAIGSLAFSQCLSLVSVYFDGNPPVLGLNAFLGVTNARVYYLPEAIGWGWFYGDLQTALIPFVYSSSGGEITITGVSGGLVGTAVIPVRLAGQPVTGIEASALQYGNLTNITVEADNPNYSSADGVLFDKAKTTLIQFPRGKAGSYTIPDSVTSIGNAFYGCTSLSGVALPNRLISIGRDAFYGCTSLSGVTISDSVTSIGNSAFYGCTSLAGVTIPDSVTSIGSFAFGKCSGLTNITVEADNPNYSSADGVLFDKAKTALIHFPGGKAGSYTIPDSVTSIGTGAFYSCTSLSGVTIPDSVTSIGELAFHSCTSLTGVYCKGNAPELGGSDLFTGAPNAIIYFLPGTTGWEATYGERTTVLWDPRIRTGDASFGFLAGRFGFDITGAPDMRVVVEACDDLAHPEWTVVGSHTLTGGASYFSDPDAAGYAKRFYRLRMPQ
ncbi:MAG: leucine-rich repeat domain-containing protein [Akkermansiaceae bacterium]|nr:leucine-rich repeat domain-containing protein [Akkermansiaceae bacterium]MCF7731770.1 leucine-rich repeat domain-containing protein [Akkermansiaceae bacterium]